MKSNTPGNSLLCAVIATACFCVPAAHAQATNADVKATQLNPTPDSYQTLYLTHVSQQNDALDVLTDLRNMVPKSRIYYLPSQAAISMRGSPEDIALAQKILADMDRSKKAYRLTYAVTDVDNGKRLGTQHFALIVAAGGNSELKQGSRMPIMTAPQNGDTHAAQVQYLDLGMNIQASLDGLRLHTKIEQSGVADEKSSVGLQDPVIRQTTLDESVMLVQGKAVDLGSVDIPGTSRHQEIQVISELVP